MCCEHSFGVREEPAIVLHLRRGVQPVPHAHGRRVTLAPRPPRRQNRRARRPSGWRPAFLMGVRTASVCAPRGAVRAGRSMPPALRAPGEDRRLEPDVDTRGKRGSSTSFAGEPDPASGAACGSVLARRAGWGRGSDSVWRRGSRCSRGDRESLPRRSPGGCFQGRARGGARARAMWWIMPTNARAARSGRSQ